MTKDNENDNEIEGTIIDVEPEQPEIDETPEPSGRPPRRSPPLALILAIVALLAVLAGLGVAWTYWKGLQQQLLTTQGSIRQMQSQQTQMQQAIGQAQQAIDKQLDELRRTAEQQQQALSQQTEQLQQQAQQFRQETEQVRQQAQDVQQAVADVSQRMGRSGNAWMLAEAEYLVRVANQRLLLAGDKLTALGALKQADQRVREIGDPSLTPIREQLAADITAVEAFSTPDLTGMAARLQSLARQADQLKLASAVLAPGYEPGKHPTEPGNERSLKSLLKDSWKGISQLVTVRRHDRPVNAMLPPDQQYFLYQNLRLQLESARLALLRQEQDLFRSSLKTARDWLDRFFDPKDQASIATAAAIDELAQQPLRATPPDISGSLALFKQALEPQQ